MLTIDKSTIDKLGGQAQFANDVADYKAALIAHEKTEGIPAPIPANGLVANVVNNYASLYTIFDDTPPPPPPPPVIVQSDRYKSLLADGNYAAILDKLSNASAAQIDAYLTTNVTTLAQARTVLGGMLKMMATVFSDQTK